MKRLLLMILILCTYSSHAMQLNEAIIRNVQRQLKEAHIYLETPFAQDNKGCDALLLAVRVNKAELVSLLLLCGIGNPVDAYCNTGRSLPELTIAKLKCMFSSEHCANYQRIEYLLEAKLDLRCSKTNQLRMYCNCEDCYKPQGHWVITLDLSSHGGYQPLN